MKLKNIAMITEDKITEIFCIIDEFCKFFEQENGKKLLLGSDGKKHRMRKASLSDNEIMTILLIFHFGSFRNFKQNNSLYSDLNPNWGIYYNLRLEILKKKCLKILGHSPEIFLL